MSTATKNVNRDRINFAKIQTSIPIPNLIEIQKKSYERFLQMRVLFLVHSNKPGVANGLCSKAPPGLPWMQRNPEMAHWPRPRVMNSR